MGSSATEMEQARAQSVRVSDEALSVDLVDGRTILVPLGRYPRLWNATRQERENLELFVDGAYIHWPDPDEDLTVAGFLAGRRSAESAKSLKKWLETRKAVGK